MTTLRKTCRRLAAQRALVLPLLALALGAVGATQAAPLNPRLTSVQMFHWRWDDVARECTNWLGPQGFGGVQVSPPTAAQNGKNWYDMYQPVDFTDLTSKMGNAAQFEHMIQACHAAGVRVYVDAVINHLAAGSGTATNGAHWDAESLSYPRFGARHFHPRCDIQRSDYGKPGNRHAVTDCRLSGLPDLNTADPYVQRELTAYLTRLVDLGVDGFRIDAAKHMAEPELQAIVGAARRTTVLGEPLWVTQEAIGDGSVDLHAYLAVGTINEFKFANLMRAVFRNEKGASISQIPALMGTPGNWGGAWGVLDGGQVTVFVNNWDTERKGGSLNANNRTGAINDTEGTRRYNLANIFMLAWPYGEAQLFSGFNFANKDDDAPAASPFDADGKPRINKEWDFAHRWPDLSHMIAFRNVTAGEGVGHFTVGTPNQIAFDRGAKGFVAINNEHTAWSMRFHTALPAGTYCNIVDGELNAEGSDCTGGKVKVGATGMAEVTVPADGGQETPAVALHVGQRIR